MSHSAFKTISMTVTLLASFIGVASAEHKLDRTALPILEPERPTYSELDVRNAEAPPRFEVTAPKNAPNVVIVLIDDIGFGGPSTFGGPIETPTLDRLAANGLRYNNFHTTALGSPTRAALKSIGFRWVKRRGEWAHNCGHPSRRGTCDPRWKYGAVPVGEFDTAELQQAVAS